MRKLALQGSSNPEKTLGGKITAPPLDLAEVSGVQSGFSGELFLCEAETFPMPSNRCTQ